jgi:hypothetical protein
MSLLRKKKVGGQKYDQKGLFVTLPTMPAIRSSYIVPFNPLGNPLGTILTAAQRYNRSFKHIKRGSSTSPYPDLATIYHRLAISDPEDNMFEDIYLGDM